MSILLTFFIFVVVNQAGADDVKSMENTTNQDTAIKMDENRVGVQKKMESTEESVTSLKKLNPRLQSTTSYSGPNRGTTTGSRTKLRLNFLKLLEQKKKLYLSDSLHKAIYSYEFFQDPWRDRFLRSPETNGTNNFGPAAPNRYLNSDGEKYLEEGKIQSTLKLLQLKKEEVFNEIFVGFRFSFGAKNTHTFPEMRISPSFEKGAGLIIAF